MTVTISLNNLQNVFDVYCEEVKEHKQQAIPYADFKAFQHFLKAAKKDSLISVTFEKKAGLEEDIFCIEFSDRDYVQTKLFNLPKPLIDKIRYASDEWIKCYKYPLEDYTDQNGYKWWVRSPEPGWKASTLRATINNSNSKNEKENDEMNTTNMMPKFDFGPVDGSKVRLSPYGMAIKNKDGAWVSYDAINSTVIQVDGFAFDMAQMIYKMPVAISQVQKGDMVIHNHVPMYVVGNPNGNSLSVVDIYEGEAKSVMPTTNMFGFNFVTKVVSLMNVPNAQPDPSNPFGNIMPFLMMQQLFGDGNSAFGSDMDFGKLMMMSYFMGGINPFGQMFAGMMPNAASTMSTGGVTPAQPQSNK